MGTVVGWLRSGSAVRVIQFLLLVNALPAFVVLMAAPGHTSPGMGVSTGIGRQIGQT